jgi:hypothetical protein
MQLSNILKSTIKLTLTSLCVAYITYAHADKLANMVHSIKYSFVETEQGFVPKEQALDIKIKYERNDRNKLETYLKTYNQKLPILMKPEGIQVGNIHYIASNIDDDERTELCGSAHNISTPTKEKKISKADKVKKILYDIYKNVEDIKDDE